MKRRRRFDNGNAYTDDDSVRLQNVNYIAADVDADTQLHACHASAVTRCGRSSLQIAYCGWTTQQEQASTLTPANLHLRWRLSVIHSLMQNT